jgi:hypothetical protein
VGIDGVGGEADGDDGYDGGRVRNSERDKEIEVGTSMECTMVEAMLMLACSHRVRMM